MSPSNARIAILGGGPAGLTLGVLLHKRNIPFTIFELRQKPTEDELSKPCGMLDLHEESGIAALRACGLYDEFLKLTGECSEANKIADKDGNILYEDAGETSERPEISRHALSKLLMSHLPSEAIQWGRKVASVSKITASDQPEIVLNFADHKRQTFTLVIGADGAWSRVRSLLTSVKPHYGGHQNVTATIRNITTRYPHLAQLVGHGTFSALGLRHGVMSQRGPQDSARIYVFLSLEDEHFPSTSGLVSLSAAEAKDKLLTDPALLGNFGPVIKELVTVACNEDSIDHRGSAIDLKPMYTLPIGHAWEHQAGATLVGDASHIMGPWAGEGVNLGMWDSLDLAHAIISAHQTASHDNTTLESVLDPLIKDFEMAMLDRAREKAEETASNQQMMMSDDGANNFVKFFVDIGAGAPRPE